MSPSSMLLYGHSQNRQRNLPRLRSGIHHQGLYNNTYFHIGGGGGVEDENYSQDIKKYQDAFA